LSISGTLPYINRAPAPPHPGAKTEPRPWRTGARGPPICGSGGRVERSNNSLTAASTCSVGVEINCARDGSSIAARPDLLLCKASGRGCQRHSLGEMPMAISPMPRGNQLARGGLVARTVQPRGAPPSPLMGGSRAPVPRAGALSLRSESGAAAGRIITGLRSRAGLLRLVQLKYVTEQSASLDTVVYCITYAGRVALRKSTGPAT
jgi:hypothetical protein